MTLHIFNPEHDLALACNKANFTPPHAARGLRNDLGFLPALWAEDGDKVLVDNCEVAEKALRKVAVRIGRRDIEWKRRRIAFVEPAELVALADYEGMDNIDPWGWDATLRCALMRNFGRTHTALPTLEQLDDIRTLSHRRVAAEVLKRIEGDGVVGKSFECRAIDEVRELAARFGRVVLKAPWSGSGRGIRFIDDVVDYHRTGWVNNLIASQGAVMLEPFYNKVEDFGMEFRALADGSVVYEGLSVFSTQNGAYTGNVLATETAKQEMLGRYLSPALLDDVKGQIIRHTCDIFRGRYQGPFGVDMMVVASPDGDRCKLHPCVEINLRRTMGHVALTLSPDDDEVKRVMRIDYNKDKYQLIIEN